mgnify:FL=1
MLFAASPNGKRGKEDLFVNSLTLHNRMATIIITPGNGNTDSGAGPVALVVGALVLLAAVALFVFYGLPAMKGAPTAAAPQERAIDVNVTLPEPVAAEPAPTAPAPEPAQN